MRNLRALDQYRLVNAEVMRMRGCAGDDTFGCFLVPSKVDGGTLKVIASASERWDLVSVSGQNRCPNWTEMEQIKRLFFKDDEVAMQLHVPVADHISVHPYCLHMWRPNDSRVIPLPPKDTVG